MSPFHLTALGLGLVLLGGALAASERVSLPLLAGGVVLMAIAGYRWLRGRTRDRYDLGALREVHDRVELEEIEVGTAREDAGSITCPHCLQAYDRRLGICPNCRR